MNAEDLQVELDKINPILQFPVSVNVHKVGQYLVVASWYHSYIPDFAATVTPLTLLLRKK